MPHVWFISSVFRVSHSERLSLFLTSLLIVLMDYALLTTGFKKENKQIKPVCFHNMEYSSIKLLFHYFIAIMVFQICILSSSAKKGIFWRMFFHTIKEDAFMLLFYSKKKHYRCCSYDLPPVSQSRFKSSPRLKCKSELFQLKGTCTD